jgi:hypothetical protein
MLVRFGMPEGIVGDDKPSSGTWMARWERILEQARNNPRDVRLSDACKLAEKFGFKHRAGGKHPHVFTRKGFKRMLNFQDDGNGKAKRPQVLQLHDAIEELGGVPPDEDKSS